MQVSDCNMHLFREIQGQCIQVLLRKVDVESGIIIKRRGMQELLKDHVLEHDPFPAPFVDTEPLSGGLLSRSSCWPCDMGSPSFVFLLGL